MADTKSWREIRRARALNEASVEGYGLLMDAVAQLTELCLERGVSEAQLAQAFAELEVEAPDPAGNDSYLSALSRCVTALGGHVEVRAVFDDEAVTMLRTDGRADRRTGSGEKRNQ